MAQCISCGLEVVGGKLKVQLRPGGGIACDNSGDADDGLYVVAGAVVPGISPDACNGLAQRGNGYYTPCPDAVTGWVNQGSINNNVLPLAITGTNNSYGFIGTQITIPNPTCCEVSGMISVRAGNLYIDMNDGFWGSCNLHVNINGGGFVNSNPDCTMVVENRTGGVLHDAFNGAIEESWISIPAGGSVTHNAELVVLANLGTATLHGAVTFEYIWSLPQTGCC